jgi:lysozyme
MARGFVIAAGVLAVGVAAYVLMSDDQTDQQDPTILEDAMSSVSNLVTSVADAVNHPQVQAFLALIRTGEGTAGPNGYRTMFGGGLFVSLADHPRRANTRSGITSTAAGAYQFLTGTWDEMAAKYDLVDFSPASQDVAAVGLIKRRGALADVLAGRFRAAIDKCNREWASLPGSPYGQPTLSYERAQSVLVAAGAQFAGAAV